MLNFGSQTLAHASGGIPNCSSKKWLTSSNLLFIVEFLAKRYIWQTRIANLSLTVIIIHTPFKALMASRMSRMVLNTRYTVMLKVLPIPN